MLLHHAYQVDCASEFPQWQSSLKCWRHTMLCAPWHWSGIQAWGWAEPTRYPVKSVTHHSTAKTLPKLFTIFIWQLWISYYAMHCTDTHLWSWPSDNKDPPQGGGCRGNLRSRRAPSNSPPSRSIWSRFQILAMDKVKKGLQLEYE